MSLDVAMSYIGWYCDTLAVFGTGILSLGLLIYAKYGVNTCIWMVLASLGYLEKGIYTRRGSDTCIWMLVSLIRGVEYGYTEYIGDMLSYIDGRSRQICCCGR